jgi:uncharacterized membrane protein YgaE (UPF0421/DUF939 family)
MTESQRRKGPILNNSLISGETVMQEENESAKKRARRVSEIDQKEIQIHFSRDVLRSFNRLEAAVHKSEHYSDELLENLQELSEGKPIPGIGAALTEMALIARETMRHVRATGEQHAEEVLGELISHLMGQELDAKPVFAVLASKARAR